MKQRINRRAGRSSPPSPPQPPLFSIPGRAELRRCGRFSAARGAAPALPLDSFSNKRVHVVPPAEQPIALPSNRTPRLQLDVFRLFDFQMTNFLLSAASSRAPPPPHSNRPRSQSCSERSRLFPPSLIAAYVLARFCVRTRSSFARALYQTNSRSQSGVSHLFQLRETTQKSEVRRWERFAQSPGAGTKRSPQPPPRLHLRTQQQVAPSVLFYAALSLISLRPGSSTVCLCFTSQHFGLCAAVFHPELSKGF